MSRASDEDPIVEMLRRLGQETPVPDVDPQRERDLLAAFEASLGQPRPGVRRRPMFAAAAILAMAATVGLAVAYRSRPPLATDREAVAPNRGPIGATEFVLWPGAAELPTFESGQLMRVEIPASVATELGLTLTPSADGVAHADILVGQDGWPRAVRLVNDF